MLKQVFELWDACFGVAKGNLLLCFMEILGSTKVNTKAKAPLWPIHYPEACVMLSLTLSHLFLLRQNVSRSVIFSLGSHLGKSWCAIEGSCWPICNYTVTLECYCGGNLCSRDHRGSTKSWVQPWTSPKFWMKDMGRGANKSWQCTAPLKSTCTVVPNKAAPPCCHLGELWR